MAIPLIIIISGVIGFLLGTVFGTKKRHNALPEPDVIPEKDTLQEQENEALKQKIADLQQTLEHERGQASDYRREMKAYLQKVNTAVDNLCAAVDNIRRSVVAPSPLAEPFSAPSPEESAETEGANETISAAEEIQPIIKKEENKNIHPETLSHSTEETLPDASEQRKQSGGEDLASVPVDNSVDNSGFPLHSESPQESIKRHLDQSKQR